MNIGSNSERRSHSSPKKAPRLRTRLREAAREAILEAAEAVFAEKGIQTARVEEIAARSGVSVGTLYNYFGDREGLVEALLDLERSELMDKADAILAKSKGRPFAERLEAFLDVVLAHFQEHRRLFTLLSDDELRSWRAVMRRHRCVMHDLGERVEDLVRHGIKEGALRADSELLQGAMVSGALKTLFGRQILDGDPRLLKVTGAEIVKLFLEGARRHA